MGNYRIIGIDPGVNGGIATVDTYEFSQAYPDSIRLYQMPKGSREERAVYIARLIKAIEPARTIIEKVQGFHGGRSTPVTSFIMGESFGHLTGAASVLESELYYITPQAWMKQLGLKRGKGMSQGQWKSSLRDHAHKLFPDVKGITLKTCDALLILQAGLDKYFKLSLLNGNIRTKEDTTAAEAHVGLGD